MTKVAVVTGGNKGIGYAITERLGKELKGWAVYLTARNPDLGQASVKKLADKGVNVNFHQLDITSEESIKTFAGYVKEKYSGLDILVNNAGFAYKAASTAPAAEQAEVTIKTNFYGTLNVCKHLFPLLRPHARVVHVSSTAATMSLEKMSDDLKKKFVAQMTMQELIKSLEQFVSDVKAGTSVQKGWPDWNYGMSKVGVTCMTFIQQRKFNSDPREDLVVNACCPGYVDTDMTSHKGHLTIEEGADTPCYLATLPPNTDVKGKHLRERKIVAWQ